MNEIWHDDENFSRLEFRVPELKVAFPSSSRSNYVASDRAQPGFCMNSIQADLTDSQQAELKASSLFNPDLAPVSAAQRKWRAGSFAALWISMSACIPTYMHASSLIGGGINWWQAVLTIFLGHLIVLVPM